MAVLVEEQVVGLRSQKSLTLVQLMKSCNSILKRPGPRKKGYHYLRLLPYQRYDQRGKEEREMAEVEVVPEVTMNQTRNTYQ